MIAEIMAVVCVFGLLGIVILKSYNITKLGGYYPVSWSLILLTLGLFLWGIFFISAAGSVSAVETITSASTTYTVTSNEYVSMFLYLQITTFLVVLAGMLTVFEALLAINPLVIRKRNRGR